MAVPPAESQFAWSSPSSLDSTLSSHFNSASENPDVYEINENDNYDVDDNDDYSSDDDDDDVTDDNDYEYIQEEQPSLRDQDNQFSVSATQTLTPCDFNVNRQTIVQEGWTDSQTWTDGGWAARQECVQDRYYEGDKQQLQQNNRLHDWSSCRVDIKRTLRDLLQHLSPNSPSNFCPREDYDEYVSTQHKTRRTADEMSCQTQDHERYSWKILRRDIVFLDEFQHALKTSMQETNSNIDDIHKSVQTDSHCAAADSQINYNMTRTVNNQKSYTVLKQVSLLVLVMIVQFSVQFVLFA